MNSIRVMMVDDHILVRRGMAVFLSGFDDLELVGEAGTGREALDLCATAQPDVILMDIMLPDTDGITITRTIRAQYPNVQVVMLTSSLDEGLVRSALQAGAIGYMLKNIAIDEMAATIRAVHAGKPTLSPEAAQTLINMAVQPRKSANTYQLTERERTILDLMVQCLNNQEIADQLFVSRATVKAYVSTILSKLGVKSRVEAVRLAVEQSLIKSTN